MLYATSFLSCRPGALGIVLPDSSEMRIDGVLDAQVKLASIFSSGGMLGLFLLGVGKMQEGRARQAMQSSP